MGYFRVNLSWDFVVQGCGMMDAGCEADIGESGERCKVLRSWKLGVKRAGVNKGWRCYWMVVF